MYGVRCIRLTLSCMERLSSISKAKLPTCGARSKIADGTRNLVKHVEPTHSVSRGNWKPTSDRYPARALWQRMGDNSQELACTLGMAHMPNYIIMKNSVASMQNQGLYKRRDSRIAVTRVAGGCGGCAPGDGPGPGDQRRYLERRAL